jgi:hypothetical protein
MVQVTGDETEISIGHQSAKIKSIKFSRSERIYSVEVSVSGNHVVAISILICR